ncbi:MAG: tRNA 4-thiouridine(8) synthase ThiI, partial [Bacilli bacterium]|nr:tRNA 4-thiouridine(8) synthase ThiI [Bacilli bacterium]
MNRVILIKYGELTTKKGNRNFFINTLYQMILKKLKNYDVKISKDISRMYIEFNDVDLDQILDRINHIFGIHTYQVAIKIDSNEDIINQNVIDYIISKDFKTFKVEVKRCDKKFPISSMDYSRKLGGLILKNKDNISVDVHNPEMLLKVEILEKFTYIYSDTYKGLGGYPVGT